MGVTITAMFGDYFWISDLASHFRHLYFFLSLMLLFIAVLAKIKDFVVYIFLVTVVAANGFFVSQFYFITTFKKEYAHSHSVIALNLNRFNSATDLLKLYLAEKKPDFVILSELTPEWAEQVKSLEDIFPFAKAIVRSDNFGIGILSQFPLEIAETYNDQIEGVPFLSVRAQLQSQWVMLVAAHAFPPISSQGKESRDQYLKLVADHVKNRKNSVILCGDFNATPWSKAFGQLVKESNLLHPKEFGVIATWPSQFIPYLALPLDHCLVSRDIKVTGYKRGAFVGSDHYPLEMNFLMNIDRVPSSK